MINVTRSSMPELEEYVEEIKDLWDSRWLTNMGEKHRRLEEELKKYLQVPLISLYANGHLALENVIEAFNFPAGAEVITTPYTFVSTTHAIIRSGLKPVFCDINPEDFTIDAEKIESLITEKTVAIIPVHVYGNVCDVEKIEEAASRRGLKVIYDAAHAFGVKYNGKGIANYGDASMFSFHATKVFNTIEGGAVCYKDERLTQVLKDLKNFGIHGTETVSFVGGNAKMNEFQAAMGICNLRHIDREIAKRKIVYDRYFSRLCEVEGIRLNKFREGVSPNYSYFPIVVNENKFGKTRNEIYESLLKNGIRARKYFYPATNAFDCVKERCDVLSTPVAEYVSDRVLTLPLYADLEEKTVDEICDIILR